MKTFSLLIGALGALSATASAAQAGVDTSRWKCETCPFEKAGSSATVELGAGAVSSDSAKYGDYNGLNRKGGFVVSGAAARYRDDGGAGGEGALSGSVTASDFGLDSRSLAAELAQEGLYTLRLGYAEIPHHLSDSARTPFLGSGAALTLPGGFPAATTAAMPLATTLQAVDLGFKRTRIDLGVAVTAGQDWTHRVALRHDERDGAQRFAGSFFSTSSQLAAPVDQVTDQLEVSTSYASRSWQASLAYHASLFRNGQPSLTWANPFPSVVAGSGSGQLALPPDNQFHQLVASGGHDISPRVRASAEIAVGRMTQDAAYLEPTLNTSLGVTRPAASLNGRADTLNASLRLTAAATERLRLNASLARDERDNRTPSLAYPSVATDMFVGAPRSNPAFSFTHDKLKLGADYRGPGRWKFSAGADHDTHERSLQEVQTTREATLWGRASTQALDNVSLALKLAHARRSASEYRSVATIVPPENPLLRKFNMAERERNTAGLRSDIAVAENLNLGLSVDFSNDNYSKSSIGLTDGRSVSLGADLSVALSDQTRAHAFAQAERIRSRQAGSQLFAQADWTGRSQDAVDVLGLGLKHAAMKGKLELGADLVFSRARSEVVVDAGVSSAPFPDVTTSLDSVRLGATYRVNDKLSVLGSYWYEQMDARDWRFDGVQPDTIANLLALGEQTPRYTVNVVRVALRYRF
ncbi:MAG: MtrB/PioB family decaheme-associated outer membrane protein [Burkholderiaceae bacterium]